MIKVAIIKVLNDKEYCQECGQYDIIVQSITDWVEISDEDYNLLRKYGLKDGYSLVVMPDNPKEIIKKTVMEHIETAKRSKARIEAEAKKREDRRKARELRKLAKTKEQEKKLLQQLKEKYPEA
jgi:ubiquinone biosynthesis protein COQ9